MLCHAMVACLCEEAKIFGPPPLLNELGGTTITHVLLLGLASALCFQRHKLQQQQFSRSQAPPGHPGVC